MRRAVWKALYILPKSFVVDLTASPAWKIAAAAKANNAAPLPNRSPRSQAGAAVPQAPTGHGGAGGPPQVKQGRAQGHDMSQNIGRFAFQPTPGGLTTLAPIGNLFGPAQPQAQPSTCGGLGPAPRASSRVPKTPREPSARRRSRSSGRSTSVASSSACSHLRTTSGEALPE